MRPSHDPVVYYMTSKHGGAVKIGTTVNLEARIRRFNRDNLRGLKGVQCFVVATEPGGPTLEKQRHKQFQSAYLAPDWFWLTPELVGHIKSLGGVL